MTDHSTPSPTHPGAAFGDVLVSARTLAEYRAIFDLTEADLAGAVLDCPGGAASFTAEVRQRGGSATAVDPTYPPEASALPRGEEDRAQQLADLGRRAAHEAERGHAWVSAHADDYRWDWFSGPQDHLAQRLAAAAAFTDHAATEPELYLRAALPDLPFDDDAFGLVLCSHLLFSYADRLDDAFHLAALRELVRVARGEVRVYPLVANGTDREHPGLAGLLADLAGDGVLAELRPTGGYRFQRGAARVLVLRRRS